MTSSATNFLMRNSTTILRSLGGAAMFGAVGNGVRLESKGLPETSEVKMQRLTLHNLLFALGSMVTLASCMHQNPTTKNYEINKKTAVFCLVSTAAATMLPTVVAKASKLANISNIKVQARASMTTESQVDSR